jgi:hypothetical protein
MLKSISSRSRCGGGVTFPTFGTGAEPPLVAEEGAVRNVTDDDGAAAVSTESAVSEVSMVSVGLLEVTVGTSLPIVASSKVVGTGGALLHFTASPPPLPLV